jgi:hypothetical protein
VRPAAVVHAVLGVRRNAARGRGRGPDGPGPAGGDSSADLGPGEPGCDARKSHRGGGARTHRAHLRLRRRPRRGRRSAVSDRPEELRGGAASVGGGGRPHARRASPGRVRSPARAGASQKGHRLAGRNCPAGDRRCVGAGARAAGGRGAGSGPAQPGADPRPRALRRLDRRATGRRGDDGPGAAPDDRGRAPGDRRTRGTGRDSRESAHGDSGRRRGTAPRRGADRADPDRGQLRGRHHRPGHADLPREDARAQSGAPTEGRRLRPGRDPARGQARRVAASARGDPLGGRPLARVHGAGRARGRRVRAAGHRVRGGRRGAARRARRSRGDHRRGRPGHRPRHARQGGQRAIQAAGERSPAA